MPQQTINTPRDTTLQATNTALGLIAKDATIGATNTALGLLGKDASLQDIKAALLQIVSALTPSVANDYDSLNNRPQVNGVTLTGNKTAKQLGIRQTIPMTSAAYALLSSAEKMDPDKDYIITDANAVNVPIDDTTESTSKVWSSKKTDDTKADKDAILQTIEECSASTDPDDIAGAAALDMLNSKTWTFAGSLSANETCTIPTTAKTVIVALMDYTYKAIRDVMTMPRTMAFQQIGGTYIVISPEVYFTSRHRASIQATDATTLKVNLIDGTYADKVDIYYM
jgi:hypothetical protein